MSSHALAVTASGDSQSSAVDLRDQKLARIVTPAALDSTQLTFTECATISGTFLPVTDVFGNEVSIVVATGEARSIDIPWDMFPGARFLKIRQGNKTSPTNAGAARTFGLTLVGGF